MSERPHVLIVGGGFGGLNAALALDRRPVRVTLIDRRNHHLFQPLLYQVATAGLSPGDIAQPIRRILSRIPNIEVALAEVISVDAPARRLILEEGALAYDYLILAAGCRHDYFGRPDWEPMAPGLKTVEDALEIRRRVLLAFEAAERAESPERQAGLLTFAVVGGGPTGVELAGAIAELGRHALSRDFRRIDPSQARVILLEAADRILPGFPAELSEAAARQLARLGVEARVRAPVTGISRGTVETPQGSIQAETVLWAAGVAASPLAKSLGCPRDRAGRVLVEPDLSVPGRPEIYVIGDLAAFLHQGGRPLPGMAPVAIQMGRHAAANVLARAGGGPARPFHYRDKGMMAAIGRHAAVAQLGDIRLSGVPAWLFWGAAHIFFLIGFRNRVLVMVEWLWAYLTYGRGVRLITGPR